MYDIRVLILVGTISPKLIYPVLLPKVREFTVSELTNPSSADIEEAVREDVIKFTARLVEKLEK